MEEEINIQAKLINVTRLLRTDKMIGSERHKRIKFREKEKRYKRYTTIYI